MRVLIGVDGSPLSYSAVEFAGRLLNADKDDVLFYYSMPGSVGVGDLPESVQQYLANAVFDKARQSLPKPLLSRVQTAACGGDARQGVLQMAEERRCDAIVIGARGTGPLREPTLGNVARHVVDHAAVPVLVVRGEAGKNAGPLNVLLASDGSLTSRHASEALGKFSWPPRTSGLAMTIIERGIQHHVPNWLEEQLDQEQLEALGMGRFSCDARQEAQLHEDAAMWYGYLPEIFAGRDPLVVVGHAGQEILAAIGAHHIDLVVVGARRLGPIQRLLLGSTSSQVVSHAPCSVLVVRRPREEKDY